MRISLLQCNVLTGNPQANAEKLLNMMAGAKGAGSDICVAPRQALCGPHAGCWLKQWDFPDLCREILQHMAAELKDYPPLLCGLPDDRNFLLAGGVAMQIPTVFFFKGNGIAICDAANSGGFSSFPRNIDIAVQMGAHPYAPGSQRELEKRFANLSCGVWFFSANLVGGCGEYVYNGQSFAISPTGKVFDRAPAFEECVCTIDMNDVNAAQTQISWKDDDLEDQWRALELGTRDFVRKAGAKSALIGLSGGMDSAAVACIASEALGSDNVTGVMMPSPYSSEASVNDACTLAENLGIRTLLVPIDDIFSTFQNILAPALANFTPIAPDLTNENLQARIRGVILMALANKSGALVLNTSNKSESAMGYSTLYGDTVGALAVIGDIFKTRVYQLARWYCERKGRQIIPENIFTREPSAELRPGQKDTDSLPPYAELDPMLTALFAHETPQDAQAFGALRDKVLRSRFKRAQCPPPLLVGGVPIDDCR